MSRVFRLASSARFQGIVRDRAAPSRALIVAGAATALVAIPPATGDSESWEHATPASAPIWSSARSCVLCHTFDETFSHPVNFAPSRALPGEYPLENGLLTCTTCHAVESRHRERRGEPHLRSGAAGSAFCAECHPHTDVERADMHALVLGVAHTRVPSTEPRRDNATIPPDFPASTCLTCHDGSLAINSSHASGPRADFSRGTHPYDVEYDLHDPDGFDGPLTPQGSLDHRIRIADGHVDCGSCHSLYSSLDDLLVMENRSSALCLSCHQY